MWQRCAGFFLVFLAGCQDVPVPVEAGGPGAEPAQDPAWLDAVSARIQDATHAFYPASGGFDVDASQRGIHGHFDVSGATLVVGSAEIQVRGVAVGRGDRLAPLALAVPELGACVVGLVQPDGSCVQRLEYADAEVTSWWQSTDGGVQQGWTLAVAPDGTGSLVVDVPILGATPRAQDGALWLDTPAGDAVTVTGLAAWDADGVPLDVSAELTQLGFRLVVDDSAARYPVTVDPVYASPAWTLTGSTASSRFGKSIRGVGDVNHDGFADLAVSATGSTQCRVYIYYGSPVGLLVVAGTTIVGPDSSGFGLSMSAAGDVNGDSYGDVVIGAPTGGNGAAYVYLGAATGLSTTAARSWTGPSSGSLYGFAVAGVGDVQSDGYADVAVGAPGASGSVGRVYLYAGNSTGIASAALSTLSGDSTPMGLPLPSFGTMVEAAGDVNNDGFDDVLIGSPTYTPGSDHEIGRAYVYRGSATGLATAARSVITPGGAFAMWGSTGVALGDINGDGYDDVLIGAPGHAGNIGQVGLFLGRSTGVGTTATTTWTGDAAARIGGVLVNAGDVNGDGFGDVILGSPASAAGAGSLFVISGSATGLDAAYSETLTGPSGIAGFGTAAVNAGDVDGDGHPELVVSNTVSGSAHVYVYNHQGVSLASATRLELPLVTVAGLGTAVAAAGDVDADGYDDVLIGAPKMAQDAGAAFLYRGSPTGLRAFASATLAGVLPGDAFGGAVAGAGDVDGDGFDDVVIGATGAGATLGRVFVFHGRTGGLNPVPGAVLQGEATGTSFGASVSGTGDVDGDGFADVVVGAPTYSSARGRVYVFGGSAAGVATTAAWTTTGASANDAAGLSVRGAGDVDADGFDDLVVGAPGVASSSGRAWVFHGSAAGLNLAASTVLAGESAGSSFGLAVDGAGDLNGDGFDDVVVGSPGYGGARGRVYIHFGSASGVRVVAAQSLTGETTSLQFGYSVAGAGDVNGDGRSDLIVGAYRYNALAGRAWVYASLPTGFVETARTVLPGAGGGFGIAVSTAGDVNADGFADVVVGASNLGVGAGGAYVFHGYSVDGDNDGYPDGVDCDDHNVNIHPGAVEICDPLDADEDCNTLADDQDPGLDPTSRLTWWLDADGDGFGGSVTSVLACAPPATYVASTTDCDDAKAAINPGATEVCDPANVDEDCDTLADNADPSASAATRTTFYVDADGDGYGGPTAAQWCDLPAGHTVTSTDCNDGNGAIHPGATEVCDTANVDENCNNLADDADPGVSPAGFTTFFRDADHDGYGGPLTTATCDLPSGYVATSTDCDDAAAAVHPGAQEVCDAGNVDEDCNTFADDADAGVLESSRTTFYVDMDGDHYGGLTELRACDLPSGHAAVGGDCNDGSATIHPGAAEVCDPLDTDEDCSGSADNADPNASAATKSTFYVDSDGDTYGSTVAGQFCDRPTAYALTSDDCNDAASWIHPGGQEVCDALDADEDCDGQADNNDPSVTDATRSVFYVDGDGDGYGSTTVVRACDLPAGSALASDDCDDAKPGVHPRAQEVCDPANVDEDCDLLADDADPSVAAASKSTFYVDADGDSYGSTTATLACDLPSGHAANHTDCDDTKSAVNPGAQEVCDLGGVDEDCDTLINDADSSVSEASKLVFYVDADGDTYGSTTVVRACALASGRSANHTDCDDGAPLVHPGAQEVCDPANVDEDCDTLADDADASVLAASLGTFYADDDGDGYGAGPALAFCDLHVGLAVTATDCDDNASGRNPGAQEVCDALGTDEDCDGLADDADPSTSVASMSGYYADLDRDGHGTGVAILSCHVVEGRVTSSDDCDDTLAAVHPGATEVCDADDVDEDCDDKADDADDSVAPGSRTAHHPDGDGDGYGDASVTVLRCDPSAGFVVDGTDCDDTLDAVHPLAEELVGDGVDQDCDTHELCFVDADRDGARSTVAVASSGVDCASPGEAYATADIDCDENRADTHPGATEIVGSGRDEDCDTHELCWLDADDDGYLDGANLTVRSDDLDCLDAYEAPANAPGGDCVDDDPAFHPGAPETECSDPNDYNCDGEVGYADSDADGWAACEDCNDRDPSVNPSATEVAGDGVDGDCNGTELCFADADGDGHLVTNPIVIFGTTVGCTASGEALASAPRGDCDDQDPLTYTGATEIVGDERDQDCDGHERCYEDADGDGYRTDALTTVQSMDLDCRDVGEARASLPRGDCDDQAPGRYPGATDLVGDEIDSDCDGGEICYPDADGDGYRPGGSRTVVSVDADCADAGEASGRALTGDCNDNSDRFHPNAPETDCADPSDYNCDHVVSFTDADQDGYAACAECNDNDRTVHPGATELAGDRKDSDCDGEELCFVDVDGDHARPDGSSTIVSENIACDAVGEAVATDPVGDCDDNNPTVRVGAVEVVANGVDEDCDGAERCYADADDDGFRPDAASTVSSADLDCTGPGEADASVALGDCDDSSDLYYPGAAETECGDGEDYNCDGFTGYTDHDNDGFGACDECDDGDKNVHPDAVERCNGIDDNCDGVTDEATASDARLWPADADGDGYTTSLDGQIACAPPEGYAAASAQGDCDDADPDVHPGAQEIADDGIDQDCREGDLTTDIPGDTDEPTDTDAPDDGPSCGCASAPGGVSLTLWAVVGAVALRRRRGLGHVPRSG